MNESLVKKIREAFPIAPFVSPYTGGLKQTKDGFFIGRCPFHQTSDEPPYRRKFWVKPEKGICGCFVTRCQKKRPPMDVINFYARLKGISNQEAIHELNKLIVKQTE